ncbi:MAG: hypothetical protein AAF790_13540, partial [Planctomycetota bacterium]
ARGSSSWGWAKPLNKKLGAFYTSNQRANFSRSSSFVSNTRSSVSWNAQRSSNQVTNSSRRYRIFRGLRR